MAKKTFYYLNSFDCQEKHPSESFHSYLRKVDSILSIKQFPNKQTFFVYEYKRKLSLDKYFVFNRPVKHYKISVLLQSFLFIAIDLASNNEIVNFSINI
jgi:hypothetical protein